MFSSVIENAVLLKYTPVGSVFISGAGSMVAIQTAVNDGSPLLIGGTLGGVVAVLAFAWRVLSQGYTTRADVDAGTIDHLTTQNETLTKLVASLTHERDALNVRLVDCQRRSTGDIGGTPI